MNAAQAKVEVLDASSPAAPAKLFDLQTTGVASADGSVVPDGAVANSIAVRADGLGAVAVENPVKTEPGWLVFFDATPRARLGAVEVGALPDMVTLTPDGTGAVVANEGEPARTTGVDPEGSVAVVDVPTRRSAPRPTSASPPSTPGSGRDARAARRRPDLRRPRASGDRTVPDLRGPRAGVRRRRPARRDRLGDAAGGERHRRGRHRAPPR